MTLSPRRIFALLSLGHASCAPNPALYLRYDSQPKQAGLEQILAENPLGSQENIKVTTLGQGPTVSHHIVQIRDREIPHIHKDHDLTVVVVKGEGYLILEDKRIDLAERDVLFIPRNVVHYFVNVSRQPSVALVIFSPPYDGKDNIPVKSR
jgi:quercetin dioxygenase-like cupin family protein